MPRTKGSKNYKTEEESREASLRAKRKYAKKMYDEKHGAILKYLRDHPELANQILEKSKPIAIS